MSNPINALKRDHLIAAMSQLQAETMLSLSQPRKFDVVFGAKRFAPSEVIALALKTAHQRPLGRRELLSNSAISSLREHGFSMVPSTNGRKIGSLRDTLAEILALQVGYSPNNTEAMRRRGFLVRTELRDQLYAQIEKYQDIFTQKGYECAVEGKDGIGRKAMSAWTRIYDPQMSSSATDGWYIVIHFSSKGDYFYLTLGCGATKFRDGSLEDVDPVELAKRINWARNIALDELQNPAHFADQMVLHGNHLSDQFEAATALARRYSPLTFSEDEFWSDLAVLCRILVRIYEEKRREIESVALLDARSPERSRLKNNQNGRHGQGYGLSHDEKIAVERHAMAVVRDELLARGFADVVDTSAIESFDFLAAREGKKWFIEVKGTTSPSPDTFLLTANELALHQQNRGRTGLAIVHSIKLQKRTPSPLATGGQLWLEAPWNPDNWEFRPTAYSAIRKSGTS